MSKTLDTLVEDIYELFDKGVKVDSDMVKQLGGDMGDTIDHRLNDHRTPREAYLRLSALGWGDRKLWYDINDPEDSEELDPNTKIKFLFGDIWEHILLFLAKEAGHDVSREQEEVEVNGVKGHIDAVIDGYVVDVKSASGFGYQKFKTGAIFEEDDPFGYIEQIGAYSYATGLPAAFLAINKENGRICLAKVPQQLIDAINIPELVEDKKAVVNDVDTLPERCHDDVPDGKSGNKVLGTNCRYCRHKFKCWSDTNGGVGLRTFLYANGPRHFTDVRKEPKVMELTF